MLEVIEHSVPLKAWQRIYTAYPEGGLHFTFKFGYQQAHNCLTSSLRESLVSADRQCLELTENDIQELGRFFKVRLANKSEIYHLKMPKELIEHL